MFERLPPTQTLRAFEAAARLENFTRAGEELNITHSAISHQIRALEQSTGRKLFQRQGRQMVLTGAGKLLSEQVRLALEDLDRALRLTRQESKRQTQTLRLATPPSFAGVWLVPRLYEFHAQHPQLEISLRTTHELNELDFDEADIAVWYGRKTSSELEYELLLDEVTFPVCSPEFLAKHPHLTPATLAASPNTLPPLPLLRYAHHSGWEVWFKAAGIRGREPQSGPLYDDPIHLLEAAAAHQGIALARSCLVGSYLANGRLVRLFDETSPYNINAPARGAYFAVWPRNANKTEAIALLRSWLHSILDKPDT
ncbi:LysR substrate-binding domain-containing protein [Solimicrobium silvestre]|uniref:Transcriptional regulator n=1 Tax=Solimicrobium silvestre TaxID=2099400 RepID=A0A2S9H546_9BURK|nr:LysR substrate-binding domain-containing protein [Solimicrobium silvestre]PRC95110.1 Transcriptional regulator [Solimicrobium silvestre]